MPTLLGLSPEDIEKGNKYIEDKLEVYRTVYKAFWEAQQDAQRIKDEAELERNKIVVDLQDKINKLNWEKTCV